MVCALRRSQMTPYPVFAWFTRPETRRHMLRRSTYITRLWSRLRTSGKGSPSVLLSIFRCYYDSSYYGSCYDCWISSYCHSHSDRYSYVCSGRWTQNVDIFVERCRKLVDHRFATSPVLQNCAHPTSPYGFNTTLSREIRNSRERVVLKPYTYKFAHLCMPARKTRVRTGLRHLS
jgi:hypothetical protein